MEITRTAASAMVLASAAVALSNPLAAQDQRIIGGEPILLDEAPSIVALVSARAFAFTGSFFRSQFCAGTLISESYVLTAAHCVVTDDVVSRPDELGVLANTFDLNNPGDNPRRIAEIMVHENYQSAFFSYDIAILRLATPTRLATAELIDPEFLLEFNEPVSIAGWGTRQFNVEDGSFDSPSSLEGATVLALPGELCNQLPAMAGRVDETMVCAGLLEGGINACQGDSGGPLYRRGADGDFILAGITSWGIGCALAARPSVYTNVAFFDDWIRQRTAEPNEELPATIADDGAPQDPVDTAIPEEPIAETPQDPVVVEAPQDPVDVQAPLNPIIVQVPQAPEEPIVIASQEPEEVAVTIATNEEIEIAAADIEAIPLTSSGGGSAGGLLLGALAFIGAMRRRLRALT